MSAVILPDGAAGTSLDAVTKRGTASTYLALLTGPVDASVTMATLPEITTAGYARQPVVWTVPARPSSGEPVTTSNTALVSWGPFSAAMLLDASWAALVSAATGTSGSVLYAWELPTPQNADINETIQIPVGKISIAQN